MTWLLLQQHESDPVGVTPKPSTIPLITPTEPMQKRIGGNAAMRARKRPTTISREGLQHGIRPPTSSQSNNSIKIGAKSTVLTLTFALTARLAP
jgi:hypothetical protein